MPDTPQDFIALARHGGGPFARGVGQGMSCVQCMFFYENSLGSLNPAQLGERETFEILDARDTTPERSFKMSFAYGRFLPGWGSRVEGLIGA